MVIHYLWDVLCDLGWVAGWLGGMTVWNWVGKVLYGKGAPGSYPHPL